MRSIVHELRNHLASAVANIEALSDGRIQPSQARFDVVLHALHSVDHLLEDLPQIIVERTPMLSELRPIAICDLIATETTAMEAIASAAGINLVVRRCQVKHQAGVAFLGDPLRIAQIVRNVMTNAIRYTPRGGTVAIDSQRYPHEFVFTVADSGPGIAEHDTSRIFELGFRGGVASTTEGSGIGLALVKSFVDQHGGSIEVRSTPGLGTAFTVRLPGPAAGGFLGCGAEPLVAAGDASHLG